MNVKYHKEEKLNIGCLHWLLMAIVLNVAITSMIYVLKHPEKTETQQFLHIPKSFIYNFK